MKRSLLLLAGLLFLGVPGSPAQSKIGHITSETIMQTLPEAIDAQKTLDGLYDAVLRTATLDSTDEALISTFTLVWSSSIIARAVPGAPARRADSLIKSRHTNLYPNIAAVSRATWLPMLPSWREIVITVIYPRSFQSCRVSWTCPR